MHGGIVGAPTPPGGIGGSLASMAGGDNIQSIVDGAYGKWIVSVPYFSLRIVLIKMEGTYRFLYS